MAFIYLMRRTLALPLVVLALLGGPNAAWAQTVAPPPPPPPPPPPAVPLLMKIQPVLQVGFDAGSMQLDDKARAAVTAFVNGLRGARIEVAIVTGHADNDESSSPSTLHALSEGRARAVRSFMGSLGFNVDQVAAIGQGNLRAADNKGAGGNRRAQVEVVGTVVR